MPGFEREHRLFLQAYLSERFLSEEDGKELYRKVKQRYTINNEEDYAAFLTVINEAIVKMDLEIRKGHDPNSGSVYWALVNTRGDEISGLATDYSPVEIAIFKRMLELIINADDEAFCITSTTALREAVAIAPGVTKVMAEKLLERFVRDNWLKMRNGVYIISLRSVLELQAYLKEEFEDLKECTLCMEIVTSDFERCEVANCQTRIHVYCANVYFTNAAEKKCPTCASGWKRSNPTAHNSRIQQDNGIGRNENRNNLNNRNQDTDVDEENGNHMGDAYERKRRRR